MTSKKVLTMKQGGQSGCVKRSTFRFTDKVDEAPAVQAAEFLLVYQFQFPMDLGGLLEHSRNRAIFGLGKLNGILGGLAAGLLLGVIGREVAQIFLRLDPLRAIAGDVAHARRRRDVALLAVDALRVLAAGHLETLWCARKLHRLVCHRGDVLEDHRAAADEVLVERIRVVHDEDNTYGAPRITAELNDGAPVDQRVNHKRVARVMRSAGIVGYRRRRRVKTTTPDPAKQKVPDLLKRDFTAIAPNRKYVGDITYLPLATGSNLYLATVIDCYSGRVAGWAIARPSSFADKGRTTSVRRWIRSPIPSYSSGRS